MIEEWNREQNCLGEITGAAVTNPNVVLVSSIGEDIAYRNNCFLGYLVIATGCLGVACLLKVVDSRYAKGPCQCGEMPRSQN